MKKIAILLAATMAFAINSNAQSMQSGYKGHVDTGYSIGIGDYDFGRFEVNTTHGYQVNPYIFLGAGTGLHFMSSYKTGDMEIPLDVRDSKVDIPVFANFRSNFTKGKLSLIISAIWYRRSGRMVPPVSRCRIFHSGDVVPHQISFFDILVHQRV